MNIPVFTIRSYDGSTDSIFSVTMSLEDIVKNPYNLNMADIGLILLNKLRTEQGLPELPKECVAGHD